MILVTLGTQDKQFYRLLDAVQKQIDKKVIKDRVVVQAGCSSDFKSNDMEVFDLIPMDEYDKLIEECDVLITHGGVGTVITGLKNNKKVIAAARLEKYGEHVNDHQLDIIKSFNDLGYIIGLNNVTGAQYLVPTNQQKKYTISVVGGAIVNFFLTMGVLFSAILYFLLNWN